MLFQDAILEFGFDCKVRKLSPKSINNYQKQLRYLQNYLEQEYRIKNPYSIDNQYFQCYNLETNHCMGVSSCCR